MTNMYSIIIKPCMHHDVADSTVFSVLFMCLQRNCKITVAVRGSDASAGSKHITAPAEGVHLVNNVAEGTGIAK